MLGTAPPVHIDVMAKNEWAPATVHCRKGELTAADTGAAQITGLVRVSGRWVRLRPPGGGDETWIAASAVQRIVWGRRPAD